MARKPGLKFAPPRAWDQVRTSPPVAARVLAMAVRARDAANDWADAQPRSGKNPIVRPHFEVVEELGEHRARYTVRPATGYATWLVMNDPAGFMACLDAARG